MWILHSGPEFFGDGQAVFSLPPFSTHSQILQLLFTAYWGCLNSWVFFPLKYFILLYFSVSLLNPFSNSCLLHTKVDCSENLLLKYRWYLVIVLMLYFFFFKMFYLMTSIRKTVIACILLLLVSFFVCELNVSIIQSLTQCPCEQGIQLI